MQIFLYTADITIKSLHLVCAKGFYTRVLTSAGFYQEVIIPALFATDAFTVKLPGALKPKKDYQQEHLM